LPVAKTQLNKKDPKDDPANMQRRFGGLTDGLEGFIKSSKYGDIFKHRKYPDVDYGYNQAE
jgi:hypothetical protein